MSIENIFPNKQQFDTINERLLEIANNVAGGSSKLDKPTNPSAESAVTMLADGTVGTKLLSEIGGGGGKLYAHNFIVRSWVANVDIFFTIYTSSIDMPDFSKLNNINIFGMCANTYMGHVIIKFNNEGGNITYSFIIIAKNRTNEDHLH